jgi:hypothetical protein
MNSERIDQAVSERPCQLTVVAADELVIVNLTAFCGVTHNEAIGVFVRVARQSGVRVKRRFRQNKICNRGTLRDATRQRAGRSLFN